MKGIVCWLIIIMCQVVLPSAAVADESFSVRIVQTGIFHAETVDVEKTYYGQTRTVKNVANITDTNRIPAQIGVEFGLIILPVCPTEQQRLTLNDKWISPQPGSGKIMKELESELDVLTGRKIYRGMQFLHPQDLVPGIWEHQLWYQGEKLASTSFEVFIP